MKIFKKWSKWMNTTTRGGNTVQIRVCLDTGKTQCSKSFWHECIEPEEYNKLFRLNNIPLASELDKKGNY